MSNEKFIRVYQNLNLKDVEEKLLIVGDLNGQCNKCKAMDLKWDMPHCHHCHALFYFVSFRNLRDHMPKMHKIHSERPEVVFVDFDDFKRISAATKAENFLK